MSRYSKGAITLHWLMAVLIIGNLAGGFLHDFVPTEGGQRSLVMSLHKSFGLSIIVLSLVRLGWRLANPPPPLPNYFTTGERFLSKTVHGAFYAAMLALPLSGWVMADRNTRPLGWFGVPVPKFGVEKAIADTAHDLHEILGWALLALLALHVMGIIKHKWLDRDNLLPRMGLGRAR
ncbi:cytochrome b [Sandarakinorhabdus sp.]|uniref:cytochrome b n=1 Tax=Sandarakinorhabdus sp. TaxID=1916663 RepID=UPI003F6E9B0B